MASSNHGQGASRAQGTRHHALRMRLLPLVGMSAITTRWCRVCGLDKPFLEAGVCEDCRWEAVETGVESAGTVRAADVKPEPIEWLWENYVPKGMVTVVGGFPGVGKSTINYDLAARVSRQGDVVLVLTAEDHLAAVVRPRLDAAGADLNLVRRRLHRGRRQHAPRPSRQTRPSTPR